MTLYRVFSSHVNESCRFRGGTSPKRSTDLRALMAGFVLDAQGFGIANITMAATLSVRRPAVADAVILLHSEDAALLQAVLNGEVTLARAADKVRARVQLIDAFKNASDDDCAAFGQAVGPGELFDRIIVSAL